MIAELPRLGLALLYLLAAMYAAFGFVARFVNPGSRARRITTVAVYGFWLLSFLFHLLAAFSLFTRGGAAVALGLVAALTWLTGYRPLDLWDDVLDLINAFCETILEATRRRRGKLGALILLAAAALVLARALSMPPGGWDALTYHLTKAAYWVRSGQVLLPDLPGMWPRDRLFPGGYEILQAWAMLPLHADSLAALVDVLVWLLLVPAFFVVSEGLGLKFKDALPGALFLLFLPISQHLVGACYVELYSTFAFLAGLGFLLRALREDDAWAIVFCLMALGLLAGTKLLYLLCLLPAGGFLVFHALRGGDRRPSRFRALVIGGLCLASMVGPWMVYALVLDGAPLSPLDVSFWGLTLGKGGFQSHWYFDRPGLGAYKAAKELPALWALFNHPFGAGHIPDFGLLALVPALVGILALPKLFRQGAPTAAALLGLTLAAAAFYPLPQFSTIRILWAEVDARFLLGPLAVAIALTPLAFGETGRRWARAFFWTAMAANLALDLVLSLAMHGPRFLAEPLPALFAVVLAGLGLALLTACRGLVCSALCGLTLLCALGFQPYVQWMRAHRYDLYQTGVHPYHGYPQTWIPAARAMDDPEQPRAIAVTIGPSQNAHGLFVYPLFGSRLQNRIMHVPPTRNGAMLEVRELNQAATRGDFESWLKGLRAREAEYVMSFAPASLELGWMEARPRQFERLEGEPGVWGLFVLKDDSGVWGE